ncbi:thioesterase II family protein [Kitasatospora sp. NPDC018619]|uniref:thioesterase II family protein n=1 Tax=unclassified Kitasatospora TaxID=2633591 RepID=UPI0037922976
MALPTPLLGSTAPAPVATDAARWFRRHARLTEPRVRLVCLPHAGGAASLYREWPRGLPLDVEVLAARYPGRQDRFLEPGIESMPELADRLVDALAPYLGTPIAFFGHSLGSDVGYEVTVRLEQRYGISPVHLFVSGATAPHVAEPHALHELSDAELIAELRRLDSPNAGVLDDPELAELLVPSLRSDYRLSSGYRPARAELSAVRAPITAFTGDADPLVPVREVASWAELTTGGYQEQVYPGGHFYLDDCRPDLLGRIGRVLSATVRRGSKAMR